MFVFREVRERAMDHRLIQPASRDQIVAIIRQRAERANRDLQPHLGQVSNNIIASKPQLFWIINRTLLIEFINSILFLASLHKKENFRKKNRDFKLTFLDQFTWQSVPTLFLDDMGSHSVISSLINGYRNHSVIVS